MVKEESEKAGLKLNNQKTKIMVSGPITSWQIGEKMETVTDFIFSGSKITGDGDWSQKLRLSLFGRNAMTNLDEILQSRDITLPTKVRLIKAYRFSPLQLCNHMVKLPVFHFCKQLSTNSHKTTTCLALVKSVWSHPLSFSLSFIISHHLVASSLNERFSGDRFNAIPTAEFS